MDAHIETKASARHSAVKAASCCVGTFSCQIGMDGRLTIPAPFRRLFEDAGGKFRLGVLVRDSSRLVPMHKGIAIYHADEVSELRIDRRGRVSLPAILRREAGLTNTALLIGYGNSVRVLSPEAARAKFRRHVARTQLAGYLGSTGSKEA